MIFDDHEVTDDWYLSQSWRSRVLTAPFGRAIVRNGYAGLRGVPGLGQRPGGLPPRRRSTRRNAERTRSCSTPPTVGAIGAPAVTATADKLDQLLGLTKPITDPEVAFHYTCPGRATVRVLDTRTRRTYRRAAAARGCSATALDAQTSCRAARRRAARAARRGLGRPRAVPPHLRAGPAAALVRVFDLETPHVRARGRQPPAKVTALSGPRAGRRGLGRRRGSPRAFLRRLGPTPAVVIVSGRRPLRQQLDARLSGARPDVLGFTDRAAHASAARNQPGEGHARPCSPYPADLAAAPAGVPCPANRLGGCNHGVVLPPGAHNQPRASGAPSTEAGDPAGAGLARRHHGQLRARLALAPRGGAGRAFPARPAARPAPPKIPVLTWEQRGRQSPSLRRHREASTSRWRSRRRTPCGLMVFRNNVGIVSFPGRRSRTTASRTPCSRPLTTTPATSTPLHADPVRPHRPRPRPPSSRQSDGRDRRGTSSKRSRPF